MGELLLCNQPIAKIPYYIEGISINIYSLEELCFYILNNTFLIDRDFVNEELCTWIEMQMKNPKLALQRREIMQENGSIEQFVLTILDSCSYCTKEEKNQIVLELKLLEEKSDFECNKIKADKLMEKEKYLSAIYEYKRLLASDDIDLENDILVGNIYHNLGTAYARLFLFEEAIKAYSKAYSLNQNKESLKECLIAYRCNHDENGFEKMARENLLSEMEILEIKNELSIASRNENTIEFEEKLEAIALLEDRDKTKYNEQISKIIFGWKEQYRRINRV